MNSINRILSFINQHPLARKNRGVAYFNLVWWQLRASVNKGFIEVPFIRPVKFLAKKGMTGVTGNIYTGLHDFEDMAFLLHFLRKGDLFIDIGANVGSYTLLASGVCNSESIAFEPVPETFNILSQNIALNKLEHLTKPENKGVGAEETEVWITTGSDTKNHIELIPGSAQNSRIYVCSLDNYLKDRVPALIKIDVEGYETEVIRGAQQILQAEGLKAVIIELNGSGHRYGYDEQNIHKELLTKGFSPYTYKPFTRILEPCNSYGTHNTLYIKDPGFVNNRLNTAPAFKALNIKI